MKTLKNQRALIQAWREDPLGSAKCGGMSFNNGEAYSYGTCIAKVVTARRGVKYLLKTTHKYSVTTGRHLQDFRSPDCVSQAFYVPHLSSAPAEVHANAVYFLKEYANNLAKAYKAPISSWRYRNPKSYMAACSGASELMGFLQAFGAQMPAPRDVLSAEICEVLGWEGRGDVGPERDNARLRAYLLDPERVISKLRAMKKRTDVAERDGIKKIIMGTYKPGGFHANYWNPTDPAKHPQHLKKVIAARRGELAYMCTKFAPHVKLPDDLAQFVPAA